jgi:hypothetical protein|tara:strand:- start:4383 stop:5234 length:852 start_codon:yes stop_codon:yes gene_type:complete
MDKSCLQYCLTDAERNAFERDGYLIVRGALPEQMISALSLALDAMETKYRAVRSLGPGERFNHLDAIGENDLFLELIDWPKTFPKVWGILGWHIQLYHSHFIVTPPLPERDEIREARLGWHQDSGRLNLDLETEPRPRISLKVGFFLTDTSEPDRGNFHVIPGSHLKNRLDLPDDHTEEHPKAVPVLAAAGDAVLFDRRIWHAGGHNRSRITRKVLFYGYSYRWLKPRDNMTVAHYMDRSDPVRRQLLGESPHGGFGFTSPSDEDVPLKQWLADNLGRDALVP